MAVKALTVLGDLNDSDSYQVQKDAHGMTALVELCGADDSALRGMAAEALLEKTVGLRYKHTNMVISRLL